MKFELKKIAAAVAAAVMAVSSSAVGASAEVISLTDRSTSEQGISYDIPENTEHPVLPDGYLEELLREAEEATGSYVQGEDGEFYYGDSYGSMSEIKYWIQAMGQDFNEFDRVSNEIVAQMDPTWNDIIKTAYLHDYIVLNTTYDVSLKSTSAYDVLVNGQGICHSYSMALWYLLEKVGIESRLVISLEVNHEWNCVQLDGNWYMLDTTWDDDTWGDQSTMCYASHEYFLKSNTAFGHTASDWYFSGGKKESALNTAVSTKFDNYAWNDCRTALVFRGNEYYYINKAEGLCRADTYNNHEWLLDLTNLDWNYYGTGYSCILGYGDYILLNSPAAVYAYNINSRKSYELFLLDDDTFTNKGSVVDMALKGNVLTYRLSTMPTPFYMFGETKKPYYDYNYVLDFNSNVDIAMVKDFVDRLYTIILDRPAEETGLIDWTKALASGERTSADIVYGLANSDEFKNKGLSNDEIIERMYRAMLGRDSDPSGKADWLDAMANGCTVNGIINGFSGSEEFANICSGYGISAGNITNCEPRDRNVNLTSFVSRMYTKALGRAYDVSGLNDWTGDYLAGRATANKIAYGFILSDEFVNINLSDEAYVYTLYRTFFDREPDASGKANWLYEMRRGASRKDVLDGFLGAEEFANLKASFGV